jgi:hypothetical protein
LGFSNNLFSFLFLFSVCNLLLYLLHAGLQAYVIANIISLELDYIISSNITECLIFMTEVMDLLETVVKEGNNILPVLFEKQMHKQIKSILSFSKSNNKPLGAGVGRRLVEMGRQIQACSNLSTS